MDWYIKGLAAAFSTDQFMLFWIALEKLWERSGIRVEVPYTVQRCGHVVEHCPICNASTKKKVFGAGVKEYLTEQFGLEPQLAKELWGMRQMLHGAKDLDSKEVQEISRLVQIVRACVATELKDQFGLAADQPPFVTFGVPAVAPQVALGGSRKLTGDDLAGLLS